MEKYNNNNDYKYGKSLLSFACIVVILGAFKLSSNLFIPVFLGAFLALLSTPILNLIHSFGVPRVLAVIITVLIDFLILGVIIFFTLGVIGDFQEKTPKYVSKLKQQVLVFSESMDDKIIKAQNFWKKADDNTKNKDLNSKDDKPDSLNRPNLNDNTSTIHAIPQVTFKKIVSTYFDLNKIIKVFGDLDIVSRVMSLTTKTLFALVLMIFILSESNNYLNKIKFIKSNQGVDLTQFQTISKDIQKYLGIKTTFSFLTGVLAVITCKIFSIDFPFLWGIIAFIFNYVPAIGSILAAVPPILLAIVLNGGWNAFGVSICYLTINIIIGNFIEPALLGKRFGISIVVVILSVIVWGYIWGPLGMFLAIPLTMFVKVISDNDPDYRWLSILMGKKVNDKNNS